MGPSHCLDDDTSTIVSAKLKCKLEQAVSVQDVQHSVYQQYVVVVLYVRWSTE